MAVTALCGFDGGGANVDPTQGSAGTSSYSTSTVRTGARSFRCNPASGASGNVNFSSNSSKWVHFAVNFATLPTVDRLMFGATNTVSVRITSASKLAYYNSSNTLVGTGSTVLVTGQWYWIGVRLSTGTSVVFLQINGVNELTATNASGNTDNGVLGFAGTEASAVDAYFDDYIVDDAGFLAPSKVNLALPISDNTVTGVTDNNGVTTNIWQCVSNTPPIGVASANEAANPKAGMHFTASVTDNYIANLSTYTTLGVGASDTVLAVQSIVRHGEDIATGTKNLQNVGALTNPTVTGVSVTAGSDGGAHGADSGVNAWVTTFGTVTTSPSVTVGSSPTIQTSRTSESRLACVDFMGMNVAWTPAAAAASLPPYHRHRGLIVR